MFVSMKVRAHVVFSGYQAVVCGMDPVCCESSSWMETAQVEKLPRGSNQPFYQVNYLMFFHVYHIVIIL